MPMRYRPRRTRSAALALSATVLAGTALAGTALASTAPAAATPHAPSGYTEISGSLRPAGDRITGRYTASRMTIEVSLPSRDQAGLNRELAALYTPGSGQYHKFLTSSEFDARYGPTAATVRAVRAYLRGQGLAASGPASSSFLVKAVGSSAQVSAAFRTTLSTYVAADGTRYFANSTPVYVPTRLRSAINGVIGLTSAPRVRPLTVPPNQPAAAPGPAAFSPGPAIPARGRMNGTPVWV